MNSGDKNQDVLAFWCALSLFVFVLLFAFFSSCADWNATRPAGIRRVAEARLKSCRQGYVSAPWCYAETRAYCADAGIERTCGEGYQP